MEKIFSPVDITVFKGVKKILKNATADERKELKHI
jgi:hypothetical protein